MEQRIQRSIERKISKHEKINKEKIQQDAIKIMPITPVSVLRNTNDLLFVPVEDSNKKGGSINNDTFQRDNMDRSYSLSPKKQGRGSLILTSSSGETLNNEIWYVPSSSINEDGVHEKSTREMTKRTSSLSPKKQGRLVVKRSGSSSNPMVVETSNRLLYAPDDNQIVTDKSRHDVLKRSSSFSPQKQGHVTVIRNSSHGQALMNEMRNALQFVVDDSNEEHHVGRPSEVKLQAKQLQQSKRISSTPRMRRSRSHRALVPGMPVGMDTKEKSGRLTRSKSVQRALIQQSPTKRFSEQLDDESKEFKDQKAEATEATNDENPIRQAARPKKPPSSSPRRRLITRISLKDLVNEESNSIGFDPSMKTTLPPGAIARFLHARSIAVPKNSSSGVGSGMTSKGIVSPLPEKVRSSPHRPTDDARQTPKNQRKLSSGRTAHNEHEQAPVMEWFEDGFSESVTEDDKHLAPTNASQRRGRTKIPQRPSTKLKQKDFEITTDVSPETLIPNVGSASDGANSADEEFMFLHNRSSNNGLDLYNRSSSHGLDLFNRSSSNGLDLHSRSSSNGLDYMSNSYSNTMDDKISPRRRISCAGEQKAEYSCTPSRKVGTTASAQRNAMKQLQMNVDHVVPMITSTTSPVKKSSVGRKKVDSFAWSTGYSAAM
jgi:hypothetical protein